MSCLKQVTTNCAVDIRETSWPAALPVRWWRHKDVSLVVLERTIRGWRDFATGATGVFINLGQNSTPMLCRFYSTFAEVFCHIDCLSAHKYALALWPWSRHHDVTESWSSLLRESAKWVPRQYCDRRLPNEAVFCGGLFGEWQHVWILFDQI